MAIRDIVKDGEPILRKHCRPVEVFDAKLATLLDDMKETLHKADGVGLAAPQVGILKRVVIVEFEDFYLEMVNPVITSQSGSHLLEGKTILLCKSPHLGSGQRRFPPD